MKIQKLLTLLCLLAPVAYSAVYTIGSCTATQYFSTAKLSCQECNSTKFLTPSTNKCMCKAGYVKSNINDVNWDQQCTKLQSNTTACSDNQVLDEVANDGSYKSTIDCETCTGNYIVNENKTKCIWCGPNSQSTNGKACSCTVGFTQGIDGCYNISSMGLNVVNSIYSIYIPKAAAGCFKTNRDAQSCSHLMNLCLFSLLDLSTSSICSKLKTQSLFFMSQSQQNTYSAIPTLNPSEASIKLYSLNFKILKFFPNGTLAETQTSLRMSNITRCPLITETSEFKVGHNVVRSCSFSFNNILNLMQSPTYYSYTYSLMVADHQNKYHLVPVFIDDKSEPVSRFFLEDTFSQPISGKLSVCYSLTLQLTLTSGQLLNKPRLYARYKQLSVTATTGSLIQPIQTITTELSFTYDLTKYYQVAMPIFIVINILVLAHAALKTYVAYKNKRSLGLFVLYLIQSWSSFMFMFLLVMSGYFFFFTKATQQIYILMPKDQQFYSVFYALLVVMVVSRLLSDFIEKRDILKSQVYLIDWEKANAQRNSWRSMFIVNSLAEFYTYRTISFFWALAWTTFFMVGTGWELHTRETTYLTPGNITTLNPINPVLMYFLTASIFLVTAIVMKSLRRMVVIWWPYPFEDFLDYCYLANVSFFFCKKNAPIGYYLYATNAERSEVSLKQLNDMIVKGNRSKKRNFIGDAIAESEDCQTYLVYLHSQLENKLNQLRRTEEMAEHEPASVKNQPSYKKVPFNIREDFVQKYLKKLLMLVAQERNQVLNETTLQSCLGLPPIDLNEHRELPTFVATLDYQNTELFPITSEIHDIVTFIMLFSLFSILTSSCAISALISYVLYEIMFKGWIARTARKNIERYTKVSQGFMF